MEDRAMEDRIVVNGIEYIRADSVSAVAHNCDGLEYCMVRSKSAGVFAGYLESRDGKEVVLRNARRIWYWSGAASLSELARRGTSDKANCKFPCAVDKVTLLEAIEIIPITEEAKKSIDEVPEWTRH